MNHVNGNNYNKSLQLKKKKNVLDLNRIHTQMLSCRTFHVNSTNFVMV